MVLKQCKKILGEKIQGAMDSQDQKSQLNLCRWKILGGMKKAVRQNRQTGAAEDGGGRGWNAKLRWTCQGCVRLSMESWKVKNPLDLSERAGGNSDPRFLFWRPFDVYTNASGAIKSHTKQPKLLATGACSQLTDLYELDSEYNAGAFWQHFFACAIPSVPKHLSKWSCFNLNAKLEENSWQSSSFL